MREANPFTGDLVDVGSGNTRAVTTQIAITQIVSIDQYDVGWTLDITSAIKDACRGESNKVPTIHQLLVYSTKEIGHAVRAVFQNAGANSTDNGSSLVDFKGNGAVIVNKSC